VLSDARSPSSVREFTNVAVFYRSEDGKKRYTEFVPRDPVGAITLAHEQVIELREFLSRIIAHEPVFSEAHDIHDDAYVYLGWLK
jgi:hypothetical protein